MLIPAVASTVCSICGEPLQGNRDCLACLLRGGLGENDDITGSLGFGDFEITRRADGSPWELGRGAMGVTYRARDKVLHRDVALKVIDGHGTTEAAQTVRERFLREARAAAALRHQNVAGVFQFGATDRCYYAMELVEGETLEELVRREGPLSVGATLALAVQVARALVAAAEHQLIHRDLKPANIMLVPNEDSTEMTVKVIDFGLAKITAGATGAMDLTHGAFVGTPTFASPEQFAGQAADARSDIYSLGVTLWYALTGEVPYQGKTIEEIRRSREQLALPVEQLQARKLPASVVNLLSRALATDPAKRPQSARAMLADVESCQQALAATPFRRRRIRRMIFALGLLVLGIASLVSYLRWREQPTFVEKSIAVLPFENLSKDDSNGFFAAGLQDDVLTSLAKIHALRVVGGASVLSYQKPGLRNMREIGGALRVENVLEGSVRREGNRVLLNVHLIDARNDRHLWAERYDRTGADAIGLQGELASEIAAALRAKLAPEEEARLAKKPTTNPEAYTLYLRGLGWERVVNPSDESRTAAEQFYAQAVALDPKFALARARLSIVESDLAGWADGPYPGAKKARRAAEEALRLSPYLGEAHMALGLCYYSADKNYPAALREFSIAAATLPNEPDILIYIAGVYRRQGRWHDSIAAFERAQILDPRNVHVIDRAAANYLLVRDWAAATECYNRAQDIAPDSAYARLGLAYLQVYRDNNPTAAGKIMQSDPTGIDPNGVAIGARWGLAMLARDYPTAEKILADSPSATLPGAEDRKSFLQGRLARARGDTASALRHFAAATPAFEASARARPDVASHHADLGLLYAYQGRKEDALRESLRAVELEPENQDAFHGALMAGNLAATYALIGETDRALLLIERLLATPGPVETTDSPANITLADLRLRPEWDALRKDPRFQRILSSPEPRTILH